MKPVVEYETVEKILDLFADVLKSGICEEADSTSDIFWSFSNFSANNQKESKVDKIQKTI